MNDIPAPPQVKGAYLVTGSAGVGKTTICQLLSGMGYHTVDADKVYGEWVDKKEEPIAWLDQDTSTATWMNSHRWIYHEGKLVSAIQAHSLDHLFVCGIARNQRAFYSLFTKVFFLHAEIETIINRLNDPQRDHHFGRELHQQQHIRDSFKAFIEEYKKSGSVFIDASQSSKEIARNILRQVETK